MLSRIFASQADDVADVTGEDAFAAVPTEPQRPAGNLLEELDADEMAERQRAAIAASAKVASRAQARLDASRMRAQQEQLRPRLVPAPTRARAAQPEQQLDLLSAQLEAMRARVGQPVQADPAPTMPVSPPRQSAPSPQPQQAPAAPATAPMLGFDDIVRAVLRGWKTVVLFGLVGAGLAALYAVTLPNMYQSISEVLIEPRGIKVLTDTVTPNSLNSEATVAYAQSQVRIISSSAVIEPVIDELDLMSDPEFNGEATSAVGRIIERFGGVLGGDADEALNRRDIVRRNLYKSFYVERINQTFNIQIGVQTQDPAKSARIANAIARTYIQDESGSNSRAARDANESLEERALVLRQKVQEAERAVQDHRQQFDLVDADGKLTSDVQIARLNEQLALARVQTGDARTRAQAAESADPADALAGTLPSSITSTAVQQLRIDYNRARANLSKLESKLGDRHPQRLEAVAEVASARGAVEDEVARIVRSVTDDFTRAEARERELQSQLNVLKASSASDSDAKVRLRELQSTLDANREIYRTILNRLRQTGEQENIRTESTRLLSEALPASEKLGPNRKAIVLAGGIGGGIVGTALALIPLFWGVLLGLLNGGQGGQVGQATPKPAPPRQHEAEDDLYAVGTPVTPPAPVAEPAPDLPLWQNEPGPPMTSSPQPEPVAPQKRKKRKKGKAAKREQSPPANAAQAAQMPLPHMQPAPPPPGPPPGYYAAPPMAPQMAGGFPGYPNPGAYPPPMHPQQPAQFYPYPPQPYPHPHAGWPQQAQPQPVPREDERSGR